MFVFSSNFGEIAQNLKSVSIFELDSIYVNKSKEDPKKVIPFFHYDSNLLYLLK